MLKRILITGASHGLGRALAKKYARNSYKVIAVGRDSFALESLRQEFPEFIKPVVADIATQEGRTAIKLTVSAGSGSINIIHCAAVTMPCPSMHLSEENFRNGMEINLMAPILLTIALQSYFSGSRVLLISTGLAHRALPGLALYCISKAALHMAWKTFRADVPERDAVFGTLLPGVIDTNMQYVLRTQSPEKLPAVDIFKGFAEQNKLRAPEEVAEFVYSVMHHPDRKVFSETEWDIANK